ncbi:virion protein US10 [Gallid alphaherpesvirus 1]|nr:virion protein US10 [Gallid alphaherpesvirus 1]QHW06390.1 virion protein US10 [Gallid alphaherpesvirus 1]
MENMLDGCYPLALMDSDHVTAHAVPRGERRRQGAVAASSESADSVDPCIRIASRLWRELVEISSELKDGYGEFTSARDRRNALIAANERLRSAFLGASRATRGLGLRPRWASTESVANSPTDPNNGNGLGELEEAMEGIEGDFWLDSLDGDRFEDESRTMQSENMRFVIEKELLSWLSRHLPADLASAERETSRSLLAAGHWCCLWHPRPCREACLYDSIYVQSLFCVGTGRVPQSEMRRREYLAALRAGAAAANSPEVSASIFARDAGIALALARRR